MPGKRKNSCPVLASPDIIIKAKADGIFFQKPLPDGSGNKNATIEL
jgi:hypothetical protein